MSYQDAARAAARKYGIPEDLFLRQIGAESSWNPSAVSSAGAIGLGQLMPGTARELGVDPTDPNQNLDGAARYLRQQYDTFGDWKTALAAYNAGPGNVRKHGGIPPFAETRNYVAKIMGSTEGDWPRGREGGWNALAGTPPFVEPSIADRADARNALASLMEPQPTMMPQFQGLDPADFMSRRRFG